MKKGSESLSQFKSKKCAPSHVLPRQTFDGDWIMADYTDEFKSASGLGGGG